MDVSAGFRTLVATCTVGLCSISPSAAQTANPVSGGTAIIVLAGDPITVNPNLSSLIGDQIAGCMIYEGLVFNKADGAAAPALAESWEISPDNTTYLFKLRSAKWQDGKAVTSNDVRFTLSEVSSKLSPIFTGAGKYIRDIEVKSDREIAIHLREPYAPFLRALSCANGGAILPAHVFEGKGDVASNPASSTESIGSGPFKLVEWKRGNYLRFRKNDLYWEPGRPYLGEIVAKIIPNPTARVQALRAGEVDYVNATLVPSSDRRSVEADRKLQLFSTNYPPSQDMVFTNLRNKHLANPEIRKGLMNAIDRDYLVRNVFGGRSIVADGPFTQKLAWSFNPDARFSTLYPYSEEKANERLEKAGFPKGPNGDRFELNLLYDSGDGDAARLTQALQAMLKKVGVKINLQGLDRPTISKRAFADKEFDLLYWTYGSFGDPASGLTRIYSSKTIDTPFGNPGGYSNADVDEAFTKAASITDLNQRGQEYKRATARIANDLPVLVLTSNNNLDASTRKFHGLWDYIGYGQWSQAWLEK